MIRNLIFYCCPLRGATTTWKWHVQKLISFRDVWNGRRIAVVATDENTDPFEEVALALEPLEAEIVHRRNHRHLQETAHFLDALSMIESRRSDEAFFYCHAKGVTRRGGMLEAVLRWCDLMYLANLSFPRIIDRRLSVSPTVGALRLRVRHAGSSWHYPGTFFWIRHDALFSRSWKDIQQERYGVESYPGRHFKVEESSALVDREIIPTLLYNGSVIKDHFIAGVMDRLKKEDALCTSP